MYKLEFQETTCEPYPSDYGTVGIASSVDFNDELVQIIDTSFCKWVGNDYFSKQALSYLYYFFRQHFREFKPISEHVEIDFSSVLPQFIGRSETVPTKAKLFKERMPPQVPNDFFVRLPPRREFSVRARIVSVEKAPPPLIEPEEH